MNNDFLFELGCEELPAGQINLLADALLKGFVAQFKAYGLKFNETAVQVFATPRRLAVLVPGLDMMTAAQTLERRGPSKAQGFDRNGQASKALLGFLQGANAELSDVIEVDTDKGLWLAIKVHKPAMKVQDLLALILTEVLKTLPMKKPMRWGDHSFSFVRPVRWLVMLFGKDVVPVEAFGLKADRLTYGHRFLAPKMIKLAQAKEYQQKLLKAYVVADPVMRRNMIEEQVRALVAATDVVRFNTLNEVVNLLEWPRAILCEFKNEFLKVPREALISAMETHQKVFPVFDAAEHLKAQFIAVSNNEGKDLSQIKLGNEKVIYARLSDAEFFYLSDAKLPLLQRLDDLKKISFQEKLGSLFNKVGRIEVLAKFLASKVSVAQEQATLAARLCKCDLTSDMVQEFPELQGIMGREYALVQGQSTLIANAIEDHYKPKIRDGELPREDLGAVLALADKLDTLVGLFGVGEKPSGSGDPYALRRQALGMIAILVKFNWAFDLLDCVKQAHILFAEQGVQLVPVDAELTEFFLERMAGWCMEAHSELSTNVINSVKSWMRQQSRSAELAINPVIFYDNACVLNQVLNSEQGQTLLMLVKRARNILPDNVINADYESLSEPAELALIQVCNRVGRALVQDVEAQKFEQAYALLLDFQKPLAQFFDDVMVNVEDLELKNKRLALLQNVFMLFQLLADFSSL